MRLLGPWVCEPLSRLVDGTVEAPDDLPPSQRMIMPCRWKEGGLTAFAGRVRFRRPFGRPARIDPHERVWLTFAGAETTADVWLNGQFLGQQTASGQPFEFEVTNLLNERNELVVEVFSPTEEGGLWGEVAMEVRAAAFLRKLRCWATFTEETAYLHVAGEVVGTCERPLELYVVLDRSTVIYSSVSAELEGRAFELVSEGLTPERWRDGPAEHFVRIELVDVATAWYTTEGTFGFGQPAQ